jgi:hypothetical protein
MFFFIGKKTLSRTVFAITVVLNSTCDIVMLFGACDM